MEITRQFVMDLLKSLERKNPLIEVVIGPRQVGKTTGVKQLLKKINRPQIYASADGDVLKNAEWLLKQWVNAKSLSPCCLLVIDEVQKIENWAETIKQLWDEQNLQADHIKVILLGSSSLELKKGISESLAGRYSLHKVFHWTAKESQESYHLTLNQYLRFGGYPGSYPFLNEEQQKIEWLNYVQNSIIDPVIGKDILSLARVKSPSLFKQCFYLACSYACQELSYTKLIGQLQDRGNTDLVKHYLELFEQAFLLKQLFKYLNKKILSRSSSPKILPLCPALYSVTIDADYDTDNYGRAFEICVGVLLNALPGELFYWRQKNLEVDFVFKFGKKLWAIEVKSNKKDKSKGLFMFKNEFPEAELLILHHENYEIEIDKIKQYIFADSPL